MTVTYTKASGIQSQDEFQHYLVFKDGGATKTATIEVLKDCLFSASTELPVELPAEEKTKEGTDTGTELPPPKGYEPSF